jgi:hypothetical protein
LRDADDGLGPHPSNSRHGSLLSAAGLAARENEHALRSSSRRSPAAHTKRSMSRAALAEEKIRLLDGIGGYAPHGSVPSRRDGASSSSGGWGFRKYAPSASQAVLACALVAMVVAVAAFPEIVTAGRYALSGTIARAIAARHRINAAVAEPQPGASASSSSSPTSASFPTPAAELADESCVRLVAGDAGVSSELLALVHAAKRLQKEGKRVVWDYANAAATCPCGDVSSRSKDDQDATTTTRASSARRLLRLSASSPGASLCAPGASARETNNGWTAMFASASDAFTDASAESDDSACRTAERRAPFSRKATTEAPNFSDEDADSLLVVGARNAMCESVLGAWVLTPAMRAEVDAATKSLGGDLARVVAFHVGDEKETATGDAKSARAYDADVEKEVRRLAAFVRERVESTHADASAASASRGWAEKAARYEEEVKAEEEAIEEAGAEGSAASEKTEKTETTKKKRASVESSKRSSKTASKKPAGGERDEGVRAYVASAIHDLAAGQGGGEGDARLAKPPRDEPTLMDQFASWLRRRDAEASSPAGKKASRRLLTVTTDADAGRVAAEKLMRAGSVFESAEDVPPVNPEDLSLLERVGERFESFKLELAGAAAARGNAGEEEKEARDRFEDTKASVAAEIARAAETPGSLEDVARLSGEKGWRCVILGADAKMARRVASALEEADAPCLVVDRVSSRAFSSAAEGPFASRAASSRCASTVADIVDAELAAGAARAVVAAPAAGARVAALLQQCREDRLDMVDWAGLGVHELSVSAALDA